MEQESKYNARDLWEAVGQCAVPGSEKQETNIELIEYGQAYDHLGFCAFAFNPADKTWKACQDVNEAKGSD